jgi:hypothetical protein
LLCFRNLLAPNEEGLRASHHSEDLNPPILIWPYLTVLHHLPEQRLITSRMESSA